MGDGPKPCAPPVHERVQIIEDMMLKLEWKRGRTARFLAREWGLAESVVRGHASEASRRVRKDYCDTGEALRDISLVLTETMTSAHHEGDRQNAIRAAQVLGQVSGATAPFRHEHVITDPEAVTPAKAREKMREFFKTEPASTDIDSLIGEEEKGNEDES